MHAHETELCQYLLDGIKDLPLRVIGRNHTNGREANIALTSASCSAAEMSKTLAENQVAAGHGHFYALRLLEKIGITDTDDGVLRISFSHYNSRDDVDRVIAGLKQCHS